MQKNLKEWIDVRISGLTAPQAKNTNCGDRSFAIAVPMLWNSFPVELRRSSSYILW